MRISKFFHAWQTATHFHLRRWRVMLWYIHPWSIFIIELCDLDLLASETSLVYVRHTRTHHGNNLWYGISKSFKSLKNSLFLLSTCKCDQDFWGFGLQTKHFRTTVDIWQSLDRMCSTYLDLLAASTNLDRDTPSHHNWKFVSKCFRIVHIMT